MKMLAVLMQSFDASVRQDCLPCCEVNVSYLELLTGDQGSGYRLDLLLVHILTDKLLQSYSQWSR